MEKNTDENIWRGSKIVYLDHDEVYHFETNEKDTEALYTTDIPENAEKNRDHIFRADRPVRAHDPFRSPDPVGTLSRKENDLR